MVDQKIEIKLVTKNECIITHYDKCYEERQGYFEKENLERC